MKQLKASGFSFALFSAAFFLYGSFCPAQEIGYKNLTVADGLPSSMVYCISKDNDGRLWFGTQFGVSIFNGNTFKNLGRNDGLKETEVFLIFHDSKNRAWFCSFGNTLWYYSDNKVHSIEASKRSGPLYLPYKRHIFEDKNGNIWYLGREAFRISNDTINAVFSEKMFNCYNYYYNNAGQLYLATDFGLRAVVNDTLSKPGALQTIDNSVFRGATRIGNGFYYIVNNKVKYFEFNEAGQPVTNKVFSLEFDINRIKNLDDKSIWLLTEANGAFLINTENHDTTHFLPDKSVSDVTVDDDDNYWFSTLDKGIFKVNKSLVRIFNRQGGLASDEINTVTIDPAGTIWAGTSTGTINMIKGLKISDTKFGIDAGHNRILDIKSDSRGNIFVASDNGLYRYSASKNNVSKMMGKQWTFKCLYFYNDSVIYAGSSSFYYKIDAIRLAVTSEWEGRTTAITGFNKNNVLIGNLNGLYFGCDDSSGIFQMPGYELHEKINYIIKDNHNIVWVATHSDGVYAFDGKRKWHFTTAEGLLSNACKHIFVDQSTNDIWISTNQGLNKIVSSGSHKSFHLSGYTTDDGLPSNEINQTCVTGNDVWIATTNGLALMQNNDRKPVPRPKVFIRQVSVRDSVFTNPSVIDLSYWNNSLNIQLEGISFSAGKRISYKYLLSGLENKWNYTTDNVINFTPLPPGNYELLVHAVHPNAGLESMPAKLMITIHGPFWKESWFIAVVSSLLALFVFMLYRKRLSRIRKDSELKNHLLQLEITSIRAQMNPHFIFNSLNSIQDFIFKNQKELANEYLSSFSALIRMVLDNSTSNFIALSREIEFLKLYLKLEQLRFDHKFDYSIDADEKMNMWSASIPTMILQPLLENAIIHGIGKKQGNGNIAVKFKGIDEKSYACIVEDDGAGRNNVNLEQVLPPSLHHKPFGIQAINERIKILNDMKQIHIGMTFTDLKDALKNPAGMRVELQIISLN